jgi:hypothetical protein
MKRVILLMTGVLLPVWIVACAGCTAYKPGNSLDADEECDYMLAEVFDVTEPTREYVLGNDGRAFAYAQDVKDAFFRERGEATDRILLSVIGGRRNEPLWEGKPKTYRKEFPTAEKFRGFLERQSVKDSKTNSYDGVAEAFDYIRKFHRGPKSAVLVFSNMLNNSDDPGRSRRRLVESLRAYVKTGGYCCFYWVSWDTIKDLEAVFKDAGLDTRHIVPDARKDPVRKTFD